jgi:class 3 adenylate cyclase
MHCCDAERPARLFRPDINLAARLQGESRGGDIVISEAMASEPEVRVMLAELTTVVESAAVKGFSGMVAVRRIARPLTELR